MGYSEKQRIFSTYMLQRIGFQKFIDQYLHQLENVYGVWDFWVNKDGYYKYFLSVSKCIDVLLQEIELKKNRTKIVLKKDSGKISATDFANYVYCPVSFSINKSFVIEKPVGEEFTVLGTNYHKQLRLLNKQIPFNLKEDEIHKQTVFQNEVIKKIKASKLIFAGHNDEKKIFINDEENFVGQPDYIFQDSDGKYFVVEEKFKSLKSEDDSFWNGQKFTYKQTANYFHKNHEMQLVTYLRNIKEYKIEYGYLIYWYYQIDKIELDISVELPKIHDLRLKKIELTFENNLLYENVSNAINKLKTSENSNFDSAEINLNKCVKCVVGNYCMQKNGRFNSFNFPYKIEDISLYYMEFPIELIKD